MTYPAASSTPATHQHRRGRSKTSAAPWATRGEVRAGLYIVIALAVLGALLGVLWQWWSPQGPLGYVIAPHAIQPDETEAFVAADGRFAVICASVGLLAGLAAWFRTSTRGPVVVVALALGGGLGALLTDVVGHLLAGGTGNGKANTVLHELPLGVHMRGLLLLEAAVAILAYGVCASFAAEDDLGRPEALAPSGGFGQQMQLGGMPAEAASHLQQTHFPPQ